MTYRPHIRPHDPYTEGPNCGECRIILEDNWYQRINEETDGMTPTEENILQNESLDPKSNVRLACCIPVEPWMDGCTFRLDPTPMESGNFVY